MFFIVSGVIRLYWYGNENVEINFGLYTSVLQEN